MTIKMIISLVGGLGLFIYGMNIMSSGLKAVAGERMKKLLEILTNNKILAVIVGTIVTMIVQSSSTTTVMVIGFVNAGLMNLIQATGVILGANIGTTITAQLVAFKVTTYAPLAIAIGTAMTLFSKRKKNREIGEIILGFGILFLGISIMSSTMKPLRESQAFIDILISFGKNPLLGVLAGFGITAIIQSSSASIGLLQAIALSGAINSVDGTSSLAIIIPILLGTNIGTCVTALLSSIGTNNNAKKAALIHLFVNIFGTVWVMIVLGIVNVLSTGINPIYTFIVSLSGTTIIDGQVLPDITRQIANAHTLFNIINMIVLVPSMAFVVKIVEKLLPDNEEDLEEKGVQFDDRLLENPSVAVSQMTKEIARMGRLANKNYKSSIEAILNKDEALIQKVFSREKTINSFETSITEYLVKLSNIKLSEAENDKIAIYFHTIHDIERIGDHAENLAEIAEYRIDNNVSFSNTAIDELKLMMEKVNNLINNAIIALENGTIDLAKSVIKGEDEIDDMTDHLRDSHIERLNKGTCKPSPGVIFLDAISNLERIGDHANNIAQSVLTIETKG